MGEVGKNAVQGQDVDELWNCWKSFWKADLMRERPGKDHSLSLWSKIRNFDKIYGVKEKITQGQNLRANCQLDGMGNRNFPRGQKLMEKDRNRVE